MKTLYLDLFSGISGDMFIGALIDLGVDPEKLERELKKLKLDGWHLHVLRQQRSGIAGVKFDVHVGAGQAHTHPHHPHHHPSHHGTTITTMTTAAILPKSNASFHAAAFQIG